MNGSDFPGGAAYELRFGPLSALGPAFAFPCDAQGRVDMDALGDRARIDYLYARAMVGRETALPEVRPTHAPARCAPAWRASAVLDVARRLLAGGRIACC